jgi:tripartite-type tricarboxylate transporter receptor subunit TctC
LPTVAETVPGFEYHTWFGLWAPSKTPRAVVEKLNAEVVKALSSPAVRDSIAAAAGEPATMPLPDIEPFVAAEIAKWADVIKRAGVKVD